MPSKLVSNLDEVKGITAFTFVANRIIGKNILSHLYIKLALMPTKGEEVFRVYYDRFIKFLEYSYVFILSSPPKEN